MLFLIFALKRKLAETSIITDVQHHQMYIELICNLCMKSVVSYIATKPHARTVLFLEHSD